MITTVPVREGPCAAWLDRTVAVIVLLVAVGCTVLLLSISPDARGYDTHTQLGMATCSWPLAYGIPCPTCGATTAASLLVHGQPLRALATQPFGAAVAAAGLLAGLVALWCLLRGRSLLDVYVLLPRTAILFYSVLLLLGAWLYKYLTFVPP